MQTVADLWERATARATSTPAYLVQQGSGWREVSTAEAAAQVRELAAGFLAVGLEKGDRVALLARTRLEWSLCDFALATIGAVSVPVYPTSPPSEIAFILGHADVRGLVCEHAGHLEALRGEGRFPALPVLIEGEVDGAVAMGTLRRRGRELLAADPRAVARARDAVSARDVHTIIYTSGTTGEPKGCVLDQRSYPATVEMVERVPGLCVPGDVVVLFLPLAHTFARLIHLAAAAIGGTVAFCPDATALPAALRAVRPTVLPTAPRLLEIVHAAVVAGLERGSGAQRRIAEWALGVGKRAGSRRLAGRRLPAALRLEHALAQRLVFARVQGRLGGRLRHAISGGAALPPAIAELFHALGVIVLEGYGLTECAVVSVNRPGAYRLGTIGQPLPGLEVALAEDGELLVRGENVFRGYWRDAEETRAALSDDGWLRTGDLGTLEADGHLRLTGRKKEVIVLSTGKNVSPGKIESALKAAPIVSNALVVGEGRAYLAALITVNRDAASLPETAGAEPLVAQAVDEANSSLAAYERVRRFALLERELSVEEGELTPTLKIRRGVCEERYRDTIERLYGIPSSA